MKKKTIVASVSGFVLGIALIIGLVCYFEIPRFSYSYDEELDGYLVSHVYGNAKEMTVPQTYRGKPVKGIATRGFYQKSSWKRFILPLPSKSFTSDALLFPVAKN